MIASTRVVAERYVDSVVLMRLAQRLTALPGVHDAAALMGTDANKTLLGEGGFLSSGLADAGANDLVVAVKADDDATATHALGQIETLIATPNEGSQRIVSARTLDEALELQPGSNIVTISLPGEYAAAEARRALERNLHVFLFSSNVGLDDEVDLKRIAGERGLLCMGPDCGTAIVGGVGLGFANAVRRGPVGVVGAAGTGIQAVTSLLDRFGVGISHAIGTGGRDTSDAVGGATMLAGLRALLADGATEAIVVLSKPPGPATSARIRAAAEAATKPVLTCFLDGMTLEEAAFAVAAELGAQVPEPVAPTEIPKPRSGRLLGLYAGGSLAYEAELVLRRAGLACEVVDLGSEELTRGCAHPMLDARERNRRLREAGNDVSMILLDVVLGYGAAPDPAGDIAEAVRDAVSSGIVVFGSVVGTDADPQGLAAQVVTLERAGAVVFPTNAAAARAAVGVFR